MFPNLVNARRAPINATTPSRPFPSVSTSKEPNFSTAEANTRIAIANAIKPPSPLVNFSAFLLDIDFATFCNINSNAPIAKTPPAILPSSRLPIALIAKDIIRIAAAI